MKLTLTQQDKTVTIETEHDNHSLSDMVIELRCLLMAQDYHPDSVRSQVPDEHELDEIIANVIDSTKEQGEVNMDEIRKEIEFIKPDVTPLHSAIRGTETP